MRWESIREEAGRDAAPALFERGAVARTFDTPGFHGMTFYEVHAKSVINRVPEASKVPFRWTINPYRGCSHACRYCMAGETPILMVGGQVKPLAELRPGDAVYGTLQDGSFRRYVRTRVLAHWQTVKPAYLITLADGTRLVASGDHRFLSNRGWKHVTGSEQGPLQRPHLTTNNGLMGVGAFAHPPKHTAGYRRGYLCGLFGCSGRLAAVAGPAALARARDYLAGDAPGTEHLTEWPDAPGEDWRKGFLAGAFDAAGSSDGSVLRICGTGPDVTRRVVACLGSLRFSAATERTRRPDGLTVIRLSGGLTEHLRFIHATGPAVTRKLPIEGTAIKSGAGLRVTRIEPLGVDMPMYDITTGTGDFIANGVVSHNCFARNTHTYLDLDAGHDFDSKIVVKVNAPQRVRKELAAAKWRGEHIAMGTNVDCYQRAEGRYQLMPGILAALRDAANPFSILTKGTLILRDKELLAEAAQVTDVGLAVSVGCADEDLWRAIEPGTPSPLRRLEACAELAGRGMPCGVLMGPVVPFLSDSPAQLARTVRLAAEAGARSVTPIVLHLRPGAREWFLAWLREHHPALLPRYRALYRRGAYAPQAYQQQIAGQVRELAKQYGVGRGSAPGGHRPAPAAARPGAGTATPEPVQLSLL